MAIYESEIKRGPDGKLFATVKAANTPCRWADLGTKRKDVAARRAPAAIAGLLRHEAAALEVQAAALIVRAKALRAEADKLGPQQPGDADKREGER